MNYEQTINYMICIHNMMIMSALRKKVNSVDSFPKVKTQFPLEIVSLWCISVYLPLNMRLLATHVID
jgi:hypothetical protein